MPAVEELTNPVTMPDLKALEKVPPKVDEAPSTRRFARPDLDTHGGWVMDRFIKCYPHVLPRNAAGWLTGLIYNNEVMFLYQPNAVGLAQVERAHTLAPHPLVREMFVFARTPGHVKEASWMYVEFDRWAKQIGADTLIVGNGFSDVPVEMIGQRLGNRRVFTAQQRFVKVGEKG